MIPIADKRIPVGWNISGLTKNPFFVSKRGLYLSVTIVSVPYLYKLWTILKPMRDQKKANGQVKVPTKDVITMFGTDLVVITVGLVGYGQFNNIVRVDLTSFVLAVFLKGRGMKITPRYGS
jgi:hypothetical protein